MSLFVTFEGPDGAGKSTQTRLVAERLQNDGYKVIVTREPGGTPLGERVRALLLDNDDCDIVPRAEALLMTAARAQHVDDVIKPALDNGSIVLCDRFVDSTLAYQGAGRGIPITELQALQRFAVGPLTPDLTVLLDIGAEAGIRRRQASGTPLNRLDQDEIGFHQRVREWYVQAADTNQEGWYVVDAERAPDELAADITRKILGVCQARGLTSGADRMSG